MPDAGEYVGMIALDLHAGAATVAELAPSQFVVDRFLVHGQTCRQAFNDRDQ